MKRIEQLKAQREELDKKISDLIAAKDKAERAADSRRKAIIGGWVLKHRPELVKNIIENLTRAQDKAAFKDWSIEPEQPRTPTLPDNKTEG
ncbi:hypothetical protein NC77_07435 [Janthinobacterium lividum]|uniref:hypothetical protein n=1 Tax=Janthinobacterium lividum TaxID=29581 RepID=UPI000538AA42|nr:hypothetical protein [Janthinobacterium lividum]KHA79435.1 hypothetical protein NC77_07435 [Janthinobacterium lividum]